MDPDQGEPYGSVWIRIQTLPFISDQSFCVKIEEEELLRAELRKIEARKKEREKKTADLQKLIAQADSSAAEVSDLCFTPLSLPIVLAFCFGARIQSEPLTRIQNRCYESGSALSFL